MTTFMKLKVLNRIAYVTFDSDTAVNTLSGGFREEFINTVEHLSNSKNELDGVVLKSAKHDFVVGADLDEVFAVTHDNQKHLIQEVNRLNRAMRMLETLEIPVVSMINGSALGGGYEICLATHFRVALNNPSTRIGLPEVTLGLMPGAGGTVRLPKLIGVEAALPLLMEGKQLRVNDALKMGLIDKVVDSEDELLEAAKAFIESNSPSHQPWDKKSYRMPGVSPRSPSFAMKLAIAPSVLRKKTQGRYPAPEKILESVAESLSTSLETAIQIETDKFCNLVLKPVTKSMINTFWYQLNEIKKGQRRPKAQPKGSFNKVGIIGAGMMGAGIAFVAAKNKIPTIILDTTIENALKGKSYSEKILDKKVAKGFLSEQAKKDTLSLIETTTDYEALENCDIIIEAVFENAELKASINKQAFSKLSESGIFASNTSSLPITELAKSIAEPTKFIGMHFFSPVDKMPLVELIKGKETNDETIAKAFDFVQTIGKTPILVNDARGFYTSRVFGTYVTEGMALLSEGISPDKIENAAKYFGMPVSPLAVSDEVSISLVRHIRQEEINAIEKAGLKSSPHPADYVIDTMLDKFNRAGKAATKGFYEYDGAGNKTLWEGLRFFAKDTDIPLTDIQERLLYIQSLEAIKCYEEGVIESIGDANIGSIMGIGFAPWTGGAIEYINQTGVKDFYERALEFSKRYGARFTPPKLLKVKAHKNEAF